MFPKLSNTDFERNWRKFTFLVLHMFRHIEVRKINNFVSTRGIVLRVIRKNTIKKIFTGKSILFQIFKLQKTTKNDLKKFQWIIRDNSYDRTNIKSI